MKGSLPFVTVTMSSWSLILQKNIEKMGLMQLQLLLHLHVVSMSKKTLPWGRNLKPCLRPTSYSSWNRHSFTIQGQKRDNLRFASVAAGILSNRAILIVNLGEMMLRGEDNWRKKRKTSTGSWDGQDLFFFWSKMCRNWRIFGNKKKFNLSALIRKMENQHQQTQEVAGWMWKDSS